MISSGNFASLRDRSKVRFSTGHGILVFLCAFFPLFCLAGSHLLWAELQKPTHHGPYLFAGFKGNGEDGVYFALSQDGYRWELINQGQPMVLPTEKGELMRDPFLQRGPDGTFRMVWTWSWNQPTVAGYSSSMDLVHWTIHEKLPVMANEPSALNVWAPALYYDKSARHWLMFWSSTIPGRFPGEERGDSHYNHRIFSTTTKDFRTFTPAKVFFDPGYNVIDATALQVGKKNYLLFKDERKEPVKKFIQLAESSHLGGPWSNIQPPFTDPWTEGPAAIIVGDTYLVYYDHYAQPQHYGAVQSNDLKHWQDVTEKIQFPAGLRHGSFLEITPEEAQRLKTFESSAAQQ